MKKVYISEILNEPMKNNNEEVDEGDLRQLIDMGFPESRARKALLLNKYSKACLKRPFKKKTKDWFLRPIIAKCRSKCSNGSILQYF